MTQAYNLSQLANNLNSSGQLDATDGLVNAVPISNGGTGASTAAGAANNLVAEFGKLLYPIGTIYINSTNSSNPSTYLGFGTWISFGAGRVPVGFDAANPLFNTTEETGGSADTPIVSHTHIATVTDSGHAHSGYVGTAAGGALGGGNTVPTGTINSTTGTATTGITVSNSTTGVTGVNANYQPYITVYMWKRTA